MALTDALRSVGRGGLFSLSVLRASKPTADFFAELVREIYKIGARSLPIIAVGGAFVGLSLTLLGFRALETYGASNQVSVLIGLGLYRELAPVLTALLFVGFFATFAIAASWFQAVQVLGIDNGMFWQTMKDAVDFRDDFVPAFVKAAVFGGTAALVASYVGYHAEPTIEGTSVATTRAVVNASLLVLMFNFVLSAFLFR